MTRIDIRKLRDGNTLDGGTHRLQAKTENNGLVIRIPLDKPKPSSSGKVLIVASTRGSVQMGVGADDGPRAATN